MAGTSFVDLLASLDRDAYVRGKQFERLTKWWLTNTPVNPFAPLAITNLWLWDEWPDRPGPDIGIDLVAQLSDGSLCAIQAKCIDENADIPKSQLDSFISAASTKIYSHRLLIASTDGLSANARRMLQDQHVIRVMRTELETSLTAWPASINDLDAPVTQEKWKPLPHQAEAITNVTTGLANVDRGQMIMACGTGKTLTALWITEALNPATTLVLVPSLNLLSQTLFEWARHTTTPWTYICVCSDDTVNKNNDEPITTVDDFPFEVTTDPTRIANFLETSGRKVIFSTYQSSAQIATALQTSPTTIDFAICDEAHRLTGKTDADYATILDNTKIPAVKRLFMTATPRTYTTQIKRMAEERGVEVTSMDDETIYGPVLHKLSFGEAINRGLLSDYKVVIVGVTDPQVQGLIDRRELVTVNNVVDTDARTLAAHIGLAKATKDYNLVRTISFHSRISSAAKFAQDHPKILDWLPDTHTPNGTTWTGTVSGVMNTGQRRRLLNQLRIDQPDRHALLTNARCLTEGVDVPTLDGVVFIDPRSSQVDIVQAVGRAIRKSGDKQVGFIVLPILIPATAEVEFALDDTAFKPIWSILNALKAHDGELAANLSTLRTELGHRNQIDRLPTKITLDLPSNIEDAIPGFIDALHVAIVEQTSNSWDWWFGLLKSFVDIHGHCLVPHGLNVGSHKLGQWVVSQRSKFTQGILDHERASRLELLPGWSWDVLDTRWRESFAALEEYQHLNGHVNVKKGEVVNGIKLRNWIAVQRRNYESGALRSEFVFALEKLSGWSWDPYEDQWQNNFERLQTFTEAQGHCVVPGASGDLRALATWTSHQRSLYRKRTLSDKRISLLESLPGWDWEPKADGFGELKLFYETFGHVDVPSNFISNGFPLGRWCTRKRYEYRRQQLDVDELNYLIGFPGWSWNPEEVEWLRKIKLLTKYAELHSHANPPKGTISEGVDLHKFARDLRRRFDTLGKEQQEEVLSIPFWSRVVFDALFHDNFKALTDFLKINGGVFPSSSDSHMLDGKSFRLGQWLAGRRQAFRKGTLPDDQRELLESLEGWSWNPREASADLRFDALRAFVRREGHADVPSGHIEIVNQINVSLGTWVTQRRILFRKGRLDQADIAALESVSGWTWDPLKDKFELGFSLLCRFVSEHGTASVKSDEIVQTLAGELFNLGSWCSVRRQQFRSGKLDTTKIRRLEELPGWTWDPKLSEWMQFYNSVMAFAREHGTPPKRGHIGPTGLKLGAWSDSTRAYFKSGRLSQEKTDLMNLIPGWTWEPHESSWNAMRDLLEQYLSQQHTPLSAGTVFKGQRLGAWAAKQEAKHRKGELPEQRVRALESTPGWQWRN